MLTAEGFDVVAEAASGEEAIEKALTFAPDLVLMDIRLSGPMDGLAAGGARRVPGLKAQGSRKKGPQPNHTPAAASSGAGCGPSTASRSPSPLRGEER